MNKWMMMLGYVVVMMISGCGANFLSAKTTATYTISPDGKSLTYESNKEQQGLHAKLSKDGTLDVKVENAGTQESVVAASLQLQAMMLDMMTRLLPLLEKAAAMSGS